MQKFGLVVFVTLALAGVAQAQLLTSENPNMPSKGQIAAGQAAIAPPNEAMPDALIERQIKNARRVNTLRAWSKVATQGGTAAVYLILRGGPEDDRLLSVNTPWANKTSLHDTLVDEKGVVRMTPIKSLLISAHSELMFAPGGRHIMLSGLRRDLRRGTMFPVNLIFEKAGTVRAMVEVRGPAPGQFDQGDAAPVAPETQPAPKAAPVKAAPPEHQH